MTLDKPDAETLKQRGLAVLEQIRREYYLPKSKLYCDSVQVQPSSDRAGRTAGKNAAVPMQAGMPALHFQASSDIEQSGPAFNWGVGVMLSALNAAAKLDPKYKAWLREFADASRVYWNDKGPVPGYDVLPCPKPVDRYYDDNAWMVLALVETYEVLGDKKYLDWAEQALDYVLSGEDSKLGGGIYWRESDKKSKNACSNAPSAAACLAVAKYRRSEELKAKAKAFLEWTKKTLQDPADGLIWDNIDLSGKIEKTKWSYNTGLYLRASSLLGADEADRVRVFHSSIGQWIDQPTGAIKDSGRFAHLWLEGFAAAKPKHAFHYIEGPPRTGGQIERKFIPDAALDFLWSKCRNPQGRFGDRWDRPFEPKRTKFELIDQASVARALLFAAAHLTSWPRVGEELIDNSLPTNPD